MSKLINVSIDLSKIDQATVKEGKNGARYVNLSVLDNDKEDMYGNTHSVFHQQSKEDREGKVPRKFVGNGKKMF